MRTRRTLAVAVISAAGLVASGGVAGAGTTSNTTPWVGGTTSSGISWNWNGVGVTGVNWWSNLSTKPLTQVVQWFVPGATTIYTKTRANNNTCAAVAGYYNGASNFSTNAAGDC